MVKLTYDYSLVTAVGVPLPPATFALLALGLGLSGALRRETHMSV